MHFLQEFIWPDLSEEALDEKVNWQLRESYGHFSLISGSVALKRVIGGTAVTMRGVYASQTFRILSHLFQTIFGNVECGIFDGR